MSDFVAAVEKLREYAAGLDHVDWELSGQQCFLDLCSALLAGHRDAGMKLGQEWVTKMTEADGPDLYDGASEEGGSDMEEEGGPGQAGTEHHD